jgi:nitrite reductase/ring-hydroxylating ferredoxin subunit
VANQVNQRWLTLSDGLPVDGGMLEVTVADRPVVVYRVDNCLYATDGRCTHGYAALVDGWLEGTVIECPLHGGCFDVTTGRGLGPPIHEDLNAFAIRERDGVIEIAIPEDQQ